VTAGGVVKMQHGPAIAILHQYAYTGQGKTIHSSGQLEWYKNDVNDKSVKVAGGSQCILMSDGYIIPMAYCTSLSALTWMQNGIPYCTLSSWEILIGTLVC